MDIWLSAYNTTSQGLNHFISQNSPDDIQKKYLIEKFNQLIGSVKLFMSLDQSIGFTDNHIIDSGLLRGLFRYNNDSTIRRLKHELKDTLFNAANNIIYVYDNRVSKDDPESLIKGRFELTTKGFLHSAAFGNEANWNGIETYSDLTNKIPEYKAIFDFLIELLERMPKENIVPNPQKRDTYGLMVDYHYDLEKSDFQEEPGFTIYSYLKEVKKPSERTRTNFYNYLENHLDSVTSDAVKVLFADQLYNRIAIQALKNKYSFEEWNNFGGTQEMFNKVYKPKLQEQPKDKLQISIQRLYQKGKMFNFLASQNPETISRIRNKVRSSFIADETEGSKRNLAKDIMWELYNSAHGDDVNKAYTDASLDAISIVSDNLSPIKSFSFVVPVLKWLNDQGKTFKFFCLTTFNSQYKDLIDVFEHALSKDS